MSFTLRSTTSLPALRGYATKVHSGLEAAGMTECSVPWLAKKTEITAAIASQLADEDHETATTARVRVCDAAWDQSVTTLSKKALFLASGDPGAEPFATLFGRVKARDLTSLGPAKATLAARELAAKLATLSDTRLAAETIDLAGCTEALSVAEAADAEAELKLASHGIERTRLVRQVQTLIAETEAKLLTLHPGNTALVRAILNPNEPRRPARRTAVSEAAGLNETPVEPEPD